LKYGFRKSSLSLLSQQVINNKVFEGWVREGKGLFSKKFPSHRGGSWRAHPKRLPLSRELAACRRDEPGTLVIVTHGGVISILYHLIKGIPWNNSAPAFKAAPCCAHLVDLTAMTYKE